MRLAGAALLFAWTGGALAQSSEPAARVAALRERLAKVEARAARVDDVDEIEKLQGIYGFYTDKMLWDEVVDLFADDANVFKKLVYEMRFDEASADYGLFGSFYLSLRMPAAELTAWLSGELPAYVPPPAAAAPASPHGRPGTR